eukprot:2935290-Pleurochrysis_carterae.AAC.1
MLVAKTKEVNGDQTVPVIRQNLGSNAMTSNFRLRAGAPNGCWRAVVSALFPVFSITWILLLPFCLCTKAHCALRKIFGLT